MIGKFKPLEDHAHEHAAQELHTLTEVKLDACMRIVCQVDDINAVNALVKIVQMGITTEKFMDIYEALSELQMLEPPRRSK